MEFNWPVVALILGLVAILAFRKQLADLVGRTEKIKDWVVAPKVGTLAPQTTSVQSKQIDKITSSFQAPLLKSQEDAVEAWLKADGFIVHTDNERLLIRYLAGMQLWATCERLASQIYASQFYSLRWLNTQSAGVLLEQFKPFYELAAKQFPAIYEKFSFDQWFAFLKTQGLVIKVETASATSALGQDNWKITYLGRDFLKYLLDQGKQDPTVG